VGSNPAGLTNKIKDLIRAAGPVCFPEIGLGSVWEASMAKPTKKAKRAQPARRGERPGLSVPPPSEEDFNRARDLLRRRADALILDIAKRYSVSTASELTTVLDALDSLAELESMEGRRRGSVGSPPVSPAAGAAQVAGDRK
jgi:hypothetical protein